MSGSGRETLPNVREWWEALPDVRKASRMSGSGREALPNVRECSEGYPGCPGGPLRCPGVVGSPSRKFGRPSRMSENGLETLPVVQEWSGGPPECSGVVCRPSWMSGSCREALSDVRELSGCPLGCAGGPPGCLRVVGGPLGCPGGLVDAQKCCDALPNVQVWSRNPPECPGVFERPSWPSRMSGSGGRSSWMSGRPRGSPGVLERPLECPSVVEKPFRLSGRVRKALPDVREWSKGPLGSSKGPPGCSGVVWRPSRMSLRS